MRKMLSLVLIATFLVSLYGGLSIASPAQATVAQEVRYNGGLEPTTMDPALSSASTEMDLQSSLFDGLVRLDDNNTPKPAIAKSWTISKDGKTYIFKLRDAYWTNGMPVTAYDFEYAWKRVVSPEMAADCAFYLYVIYGCQAFNASIKVGTKYYVQAVDAKGNPLTKKEGGKDVPVPDMAKQIDPSKNVGVRALDAKTLKVYLASPTAYFLSLTAMSTMMPVCKAVVSTNDKWAADPTTYVSDGPFQWTQWLHNDKLVLVKNPTFWDRDKVKLTKITYYMVLDPSTALSMYQSGQLDGATSVPLSELPKLLASGDARSFPDVRTSYVGVNLTKKPLNDVRVRRALALAINRKLLTTHVVLGGMTPALAYAAYGTPDVLPGSDFRTVGGSYLKDNDVATAKALLAQAGYPNGKGFPVLRWIYPTSVAFAKPVIEAIQQMWKTNLGITCTLQSEESGVFSNDMQLLNYDIGWGRFEGSYPDPVTMLEYWTTDSGLNWSGWSNKSYDALIAKSRVLLDPKARIATLHAAEKIFMTDLPALPLFYESRTLLLSKHIKNFHLSSLGITDWENTYMG